MTPLFEALVASGVALFVNLLVVALVRSRLPRNESGFVARTYLWTIALRYALALFLNASAVNSQFAVTFWGDSETYDYGGYLLALGWQGESFVNPHVTRAVSGFGFHYFVGAIYYVFGRNQLLVQFLNGAIGAASVLVIYAIAKQLFGVPVARWAALFMAFFPQMIFWSAAMYKDPAILLCIALCMYALLRLREHFRVSMLLLFIAAALALMTLRFYVFYVVAAATLGSFVFSQRRGAFASVLTHGALAAAFIGSIFFAVRQETLEKQTSYLNWQQLQIARSDQATWARSGFGAEVDVSTPTGALAALPAGLVYLMFAPFPWAISGIRQVLTLPETLVWYALMPALFRGLRHTIRERFRDTLPILVFAAMLTVAYAVFQSNVGTAYRQRTQITMFFFVFIGVGLVEKQRRSEQGALTAQAGPGR